MQYSATPKDAKNLVYQLNAVDAYNQNLVKKIEVNAFNNADYQDRPYIKLNKVKISEKTDKRTAEISFIKNTPTGLKLSKKSVSIGQNLSESGISNNSVYRDYEVEDIGVGEDKFILFSNISLSSSNFGLPKQIYSICTFFLEFLFPINNITASSSAFDLKSSIHLSTFSNDFSLQISYTIITPFAPL